MFFLISFSLSLAIAWAYLQGRGFYDSFVALTVNANCDVLSLEATLFCQLYDDLRFMCSWWKWTCQNEVNSVNKSPNPHQTERFCTYVHAYSPAEGVLLYGYSGWYGWYPTIGAQVNQSFSDSFSSKMYWAGPGRAMQIRYWLDESSRELSWDVGLVTRPKASSHSFRNYEG